MKSLFKVRPALRYFCNEAAHKPVQNPDSMKAWRVQKFGSLDELQILETKKPTIKKPSDVLVQVLASSVNPIDVAMIGGYGQVMLDTLRKLDPDGSKDLVLPITLGRDFTGKVVAKGTKVRPDIMVGDIVYGVIPPHHQGCHAEMAVADESLVCRKPDHLSAEEASSIMYAGLTAWSTLKITGDLLISDAKKTKVLVIGGCGGVGHFAIQLLEAWGSEVTTTCKPDGVPMIESINPKVATVDYTSKDYMESLSKLGKFDIILDASGSIANPESFVPLLKDWANAKFISLRPPMLKNADTHGFLVGMARNVMDFVSSNVMSGASAKGSSIRWGFFIPLPVGLREVCNLVADKKVKPVVEKVFGFSELRKAYDRVNEGHLRGKIVVSMEK